jgi:hypothetical protein
MIKFIVVLMSVCVCVRVCMYVFYMYINSVARVRQRTIPTERQCQLFADRGCYVVSLTEPYGRILAFLDQSRYFFLQAAPRLYSRG